MIDDKTLERGLACTLHQSELAGLGRLERGKVRDSYLQGTQRTLVVSDRISAFDVVLGTIPFKGQVLNGISAYWFELAKKVAPNHLRSVPDPCVSIVEECRPFPIEMIVRGYLTGSSPTSLWTAYARGERCFCGHALAEGLVKHQKLPAPIVTPTTKAAAGSHDENVSRDQAIARGLCTADEFDELSDLCLRMFALGQQAAKDRGVILVDTKYELGRDHLGRIVFIDEIHTPDSSRYWYADTYEQALQASGDPKALDKEYLRRTLIQGGYQGDGPAPALCDAVRIETARRYIAIFELLTGRAFEPDLEPPLERIRRNLGLS